MSKLNVAVYMMSLLLAIQGCSSIASITQRQAGSDDPLIFGGLRTWMENDNFAFWTQGLWILGPFFPILYVFPIGDLIFSSVADVALLPVTTPWALSEGISSASIADRFDRKIEQTKETCVRKNLPRNDSWCIWANLGPAIPSGTEEGRSAQSIKIPNPVSESGLYRKGISSEEYYELLCKKEAGEIIFGSVDNVEGIFQMRSREAESGFPDHLYAPEDPYGIRGSNGLRPESLVGTNGYAFVEAVTEGGKSATANPKYSRYMRDLTGHSRRVKPMGFDNTLKSRYGYTWRGITHPHDRALGIVGSEIIILDLQTQEVMGVFRAYTKFEFVRSNNGTTGMGWAKRCPAPPKTSSGGVLQKEFLLKVLKPAQSPL